MVLRRRLRPAHPVAAEEEWDPVPSSQRGWEALQKVRALAIAAQQPTVITRYGPVLLLTIAIAACAHVQIGERNKPPPWRQPGPALLDPPQRIPVPDNGFRADLAWGGGAVERG